VSYNYKIWSLIQKRVVKPNNNKEWQLIEKQTRKNIIKTNKGVKHTKKKVKSDNTLKEYEWQYTQKITIRVDHKVSS
jgi:hypothetical protein